MVTVVVPIKRSALVKTFARMRSWLDQRRCEVGFREIAVAGGLLIQIGFANATLASDFTAEFGGKSVRGDVGGHARI